MAPALAGRHCRWLPRRTVRSGVPCGPLWAGAPRGRAAPASPGGRGGCGTGREPPPARRWPWVAQPYQAETKRFW